MNSLLNAAELAFVKQHHRLPRRKLHLAFVEQFGRGDISREQIRGICQTRGWTSGRRPRLNLSKTELAFLKRNSKMPRAELHRAFAAKFNRRRGISRQQLKDACKYRGWSNHCEYRPTKPLGSKNFSNGYVFIKINHGPNAKKRYRAVHLVNWEKANGPIPSGMVLKCKGERSNTDPSNWEAVPRDVASRLASPSYTALPNELKPTAIMIARLKHGIKERANTKATTP